MKKLADPADSTAYCRPGGPLLLLAGRPTLLRGRHTPPRLLHGRGLLRGALLLFGGPPPRRPLLVLLERQVLLAPARVLGLAAAHALPDNDQAGGSGRDRPAAPDAVRTGLTPKARAVLRHITGRNGTAAYDDVQQHFADHPTRPVPLNQIGGTLTSLAAAQRRIGPTGTDPLLQRNEHTRRYRIDPVLVEGLRRAFTLADTRPGLLRR